MANAEWRAGETILQAVQRMIGAVQPASHDHYGQELNPALLYATSASIARGLNLTAWNASGEYGQLDNIALSRGPVLNLFRGNTVTGMEPFTGIAGDVRVIVNVQQVGNDAPITVKHQSASSLQANRFMLPGDQDLTIPPRGGRAVFIYAPQDELTPNTLYWKLLSLSPAETTRSVWVPVPTAAAMTDAAVTTYGTPPDAMTGLLFPATADKYARFTAELPHDAMPGKTVYLVPSFVESSAGSGSNEVNFHAQYLWIADGGDADAAGADVSNLLDGSVGNLTHNAGKMLNIGTANPGGFLRCQFWRDTADVLDEMGDVIVLGIRLRYQALA